ncbi:hypothetical protein [Acetonema longum]|uniref:Phage protein n=1 Tax=Acetonema longum DSM 6540 TaxID=1009370 RepID=F7NKB4_9FIRM|nr:hypothetical protein [Acetonema longum]EGO63555.1 hypothetical protein ALO_12636 [Acetonema longum DSM 6540]
MKLRYKAPEWMTKEQIEQLNDVAKFWGLGMMECMLNEMIRRHEVALAIKQRQAKEEHDG